MDSPSDCRCVGFFTDAKFAAVYRRRVLLEDGSVVRSVISSGNVS